MRNLYEPPLEPYDDYDHMDWVHVDELTKYDSAKAHLEEVLHQVYNIGNVCALENALDELADVFDIKLPAKKPRLVKRADDLYDFSVRMSQSFASLK